MSVAWLVRRLAVASTISLMTTSVLDKSPTPSPFSAWLLAARPKTLPAAVSPVVVGCAVAAKEGGFALAPAAAAFLVAILLQIGANLANDVADFHRGADTYQRLGPVRVTQSGILSARQVTGATALVLVAAAIPGLYLVWRAGPVLAVLGVMAIIAAVAYTGGPRPYGYIGLGELFVFLFFGPVAVVGTAFVMTANVTALAVASAIPVGSLITAILVVNNLRDIDTDRAAGKRTLAVRLGPVGTRWEYAALIVVAYFFPLMMWAARLTPVWPLIAWVTLPIAVTLTREVWRATGRALNPVLGGTARLCLMFAIAFGLGIIL